MSKKKRKGVVGVVKAIAQQMGFSPLHRNFLTDYVWSKRYTSGRFI